MARDGEHFFMCFFVICISPFEKAPFSSFVIYSLGLDLGRCLDFWSCVCWVSVPCLMYIWQRLSPIPWAALHFRNLFFCCAETFCFHVVPLVNAFS
jgi:hypothetical protein